MVQKTIFHCDTFADAIYDGQSVVHVRSETIGQFTGLKDKNGMEIYEGDIVKHPWIDPIFGGLVEVNGGECVMSQVVFHDGAFCVKYGEDFIYLDSFTRHGHAEVVGNIHDNPELIKKEDTL